MKLCYLCQIIAKASLRSTQNSHLRSSQIDRNTFLRYKTSKIYNLPSWAPDWSIYNSTRDSKAVYTVAADGMQLELKRRVLDTVRQLPGAGQILIDDQSSMSYLKYISKWQQWRQLGLSLAAYPTGESPEEALLPTLCNDRCFGKDKVSNRRFPDEYRDQFEACYGILMSYVG